MIDRTSPRRLFAAAFALFALHAAESRAMKKPWSVEVKWVDYEVTSEGEVKQLDKKTTVAPKSKEETDVKTALDAALIKEKCAFEKAKPYADAVKKIRDAYGLSNAQAVNISFCKVVKPSCVIVSKGTNKNTAEELEAKVTLKDRAKIKGDFKKADVFGRVDLTAAIKDGQVNMKIEIFSNPEMVCTPHDLVPIYLEYKSAKGVKEVDTIAVLQPTAEKNHFVVETHYTLKEMAKFAGVTEVKDLETKYPTWGVIAYWLQKKATDKNEQNHFSGGVGGKGGSGKFLLRKVTAKELQATENARITDWNAGEGYTEARPISEQSYAKLFQPNKEIATTLEAESEYMVDEKALQGIIKYMQELKEKPENWSKLGIIKMEGSVKKYTDDYYDIVGDKDHTHDYALLKNKIVLRRRSVPSDPKGTFLVAVKGRSEKFGEEKIRLAAQVNLHEQLSVKDGVATEELRKLIGDAATVDNPFARVLDDALKASLKKSLKDLGGSIKKVLTIESVRNKFVMELKDNSTSIDFSADAAEAKHSSKTHKVYSFEFGVGHPGLVAAGGTSSETEIIEYDTGIGTEDEPEVGGIVRPYHVPPDLDNKALVQKADYKQYMALRDALINEYKLQKKEEGGNKASVLGKALGLW